MTHPAKRQPGNVFLRNTTSLLAAVALTAAVSVTLWSGSEQITPAAQAQSVSLTVQFRTALEPHGRWERHDRWGEVWIPAKRPQGWQPYTVGYWVYTDEWGWYWVSEEDFGWVTYHYGRWVLDRRVGWIWIPDNVWGPAWVQWRRGGKHAGWAPLAPRQIIYDYDDDPDFWIFVSFNNFTSRNLRTVILPPQERVVVIRQTVLVNRTIYVDSGPSVAFNPGIEPSIVAASVGEPIRVTDVRPRVISGTAGVSNAVEISADDPAQLQQAARAEITETDETIQATKDVPPPEALSKGEQGRVGDRPPRAAKEAQVGPGTVKETDAPDPTTKAEPEKPAKPEPDTEAKPDVDTKAKPEPETKAEPKKAPEPKAEPKKAPEPKAEPKQAPEPKVEPKQAPETKTPKAEPQKAPEPKPQPQQQKTPEPKAPEPKAQPQQQKTPEPKASPQKAPKPKATPEKAPEPKGSAPDQKDGQKKE